MKVGADFFRLVGHFERGPANDPNCRLTASGAALDAYLCPAGVPTIGAGSIKRLDGSPFQLGDSITEDEVFLLAERDAEDAAEAVRKIKRPLKQWEFDACTSFTHNLGEGNFRKIAPLIEEGRWEDAADKMSEYVRAWGRYEGRWHFMALLGLRIRRLAEGLTLNGYDFADVCEPDDIAMPKKRPPEWQPDGTARDGTRGRYFDVLLPGATEYAALEAEARRLPAFLASQPSPPQADEAAQRQPDPARPPAAAGAAPPIAKPSASGSSEAAPVKPTVPAPQPPTARPAPAPVVLPSQVPKPPEKPIVIAQERINPNALPTNADTAKNMADSTRMLGMVLVAIGSVIQVVTVRLGIGTAIGAVFFDLSRDPVVITLAVTAIVAALGWVTKRNGKKTFVKGADKAQGNLY